MCFQKKGGAEGLTNGSKNSLTVLPTVDVNRFDSFYFLYFVPYFLKQVNTGQKLMRRAFQP